MEEDFQALHDALNMFSDASDDDGDDNLQLTINEHYAKAFEYRKEREELEKLKEKYGSDIDESDVELSEDSESAESEDEHGEELTPAVDAAILRTLARIRKRDPAIYDSGKNIYGEEQEKVVDTIPGRGNPKSKDKSKPVKLRQAALDTVLNPSRTPTPEPALPTHVEEQRALREEVIAAFHDVAPNGDEDNDDLLVLRPKTNDELLAEEEEYKAYLQSQVGGDLNDLVSINGDLGNESEGPEAKDGIKVGKKKKKKKSKKEIVNGDQGKRKSKAAQDQEFLMSYILNRGWIDKSVGHVPTYGEITAPTLQRTRKGKEKVEQVEGGDHESENDDMDPGLLSDASFESLASHFEASYNHRFEEPGAAQIPSFPRSLPSIARRVDSSRKEARERRKARKDDELAKRKEEVKRLKGLKMKDIKRRLDKIGREGGLLKGGEEEDSGEFDEALRELDLHGEWDPDKHDQQMEGLFSAEADVDDDVQYDEDGRPIWNEDVDIGDIPMSDDDTFPVGISEKASKRESKKEKKKKKKKKQGGEEEDAGVDIDSMDADVIAQGDDEEWDGTEEMRKRKLNEYMDEIYGLDFNDLVGDIPTRFKYVTIPPQTYSLTPVEILLADDQELNEYISVKKYAPYRQEKGDRSKWDPRQQEKLRELKTKVHERAGTRPQGTGRERQDGGKGENVKKRKGKKERMKLKAAGEGGDQEEEDKSIPETKVQVEKVSSGEEKKRKRKRELVEEDVSHRESDEGEGQNLEHEDGLPKKKKRRRRHGKKEGQDA